MADDDPRFSTASIISPHAALEALAARDGIDPRDSIFGGVQPGADATVAQFTIPDDQPLSAADPAESPRPTSSTSSSPLPSSTSPSHLTSGLPTSSSQNSLLQGRSTPRGSAHGPTQALPTPPAEPQRVFVRAKYDFEATDESALSFSAGEVIEVYTKLDSGWWDGLLGSTRGWFPSNFVEPYDVREMDLGHSGQVAQEQGGQVGDENGSRDQRGVELEPGSYDGRATSSQHGEGRDSGTGDDLGWGDAMKKGGGGGWDGGGGLNELAREVMQGAGLDDAGLDDEAGAGADDFGAAAADRRRRQAQEHETMMATLGRGGDMDLADEMGPDEFGFGPRRRQREDTERTLTLRRGPVGGQEHSGEGHEGRSRRTSTSDSVVEKDGEGGEKLEESAWVPTLTDDGQVYYHNTVTGEDSWHLPEPAPSQDDKGAYYDDEDNNNFFHSLTASSSGAFGVPSSRSVQTPDQSEDTFAPPAHKRELPANWVARLSDDGREWFYFNRVTGRTQREPPSWDLDEKMKRLSVGSTDLRSARSGRPRPRRSLELRRKTVEDWSKDTRAALEGLMVPPKAKNMSWHMETTQDALQKVLEAASLGINTEEDLGRARDLESAGGIESALLQQEDAVLSLRHAFKVFIAAIQTLYKAYGYVGPGEGIIEMPRPQWSSDLSIVGLVGRLGAVVHAATDSKYLPNEANSVWSEVIKVGGRLRDVLGSFPEKVSPNQPRTVQDGKMANRHELVLHTAGVGRIMADRWGFGDLPTEEDDQLRILDHSVLTDMRTLKDEYEALEYREDTVLQLVRLSTRFKAALLKIDVAEVVDVDGDLSDRTREDEARAYEELLVRVTNAVLDLEEYSAQIDELAMELIQKADLAPDVYGALRVSLDGSFSALESLLQLGTQQKALATSSGNIIAQIGHRSPRFVRRPSTRPLSMVSTTSRASRGSRPSITRGLDEELLEGELEAERRDRAGEMVSASGNASQTSLHQPQHQHQQSQHQHQHHGRRHASQGDVSAMSAASSTASLGYQHAESDGGSVRGKRTSLMNFMRGRSNTDDDGRGTLKSKGQSKKLAKLLGEDFTASQAGPAPFASIPPPPSVPAFLSPPETPWYLGDDYAPADIVIDDKGQVRGGTLPALVARLTPHGATDTAFFQAFLLTFRSFTTGSELVELLFDRYMLEPPDSLDERQYAEWKKMKQTPIRLRVSNVLRSWLDVHYLEAEDAVVLDPIENFASTTMASEGSELLSRQLVALVQRRRMGEPVGDRKGQQRIVSASDNGAWPPLLIPRNGRIAKITDVPPLEMARQLTIIEFQHFQNITMNECLNKRWTGTGCDHLAPNIRAIIRMANVVAGWVTTCIIGQRDVKARAGMVKYWIQTSQELRNLNNFSSMASVMAGVNSAPVLRLKRTNELIAPKYWTMKNGLDKTLDSTKNFSNYKDMLKTINPPCVPFFGFWLSALTFIEDGNKNFLKPPGSDPAQPPPSSASGLAAQTPLTSSTSTSTSLSAASTSASPAVLPPRPAPQPSGPLINFFKHSLAAEILRDIQQYQSQPYTLARSTLVSEYIMAQFERFKKDLPNMDRLYEQSLELEPREREEERITRMLHDSNPRKASMIMSLMP